MRDTDLWITIQLQMATPSIMYHIAHFFCSTRYNFNIWTFKPAPVVVTSNNGLPLQTNPTVPFPALCKFQMPRHTLYWICASHMILCQIWQFSGVHIALKTACLSMELKNRTWQYFHSAATAVEIFGAAVKLVGRFLMPGWPYIFT